MRSLQTVVRGLVTKRRSSLGNAPPMVEACESRQHLTGTISFVDVAIDSAAKAADPTLNNLRTLDVRLTVTSGDDWLASDLRLSLTAGSFYNSAGNVPVISDWSANPQQRFDTWVGGPGFSQPTVLGRKEGSGAAIFSASEVNVAFGDLSNTGGSTFTVARLTMTQDAVGTLNGTFFTLVAPSSSVPFTRNITAATPAATTIKGWVFNDIDADGVQDTNESRLSGWQAYIDGNNNGRLDTGEKSVKTNSSGNYTFGELNPGTYRVRLTLKADFRRTAPTAGSFNVALTTGVTADRKVFGVTQRGLISGSVFNDADNDRTKDSGEAGLSGWRVYIDRDNDSKFDSNETSVRSGTDGSWKFNDLGAGTYNVRIVQVTGFSRTTPTSGVFSVVVANGSEKTGNLFGQRAV